MSAQTVTLLERTLVARETMGFRFSKPEGFDFRAGQAIDLILPAHTGLDGSGARHAFSIVSAPSESDLTIATRMRGSAYKRALASLAIGAQVEVDGPFGSLDFAADTRPSVLVAGGIGITPFMSILRDLDRIGGTHKVTLLYANRLPEDAAYLGELDGMAQRASWLKFVPTMTGAAVNASWLGARRRLDEELLREAVPELMGSNYFVVGPPPMVEGVLETLAQLGVEEKNVKTESFYGY